MKREKPSRETYSGETHPGVTHLEFKNDYNMYVTEFIGKDEYNE